MGDLAAQALREYDALRGQSRELSARQGATGCSIEVGEVVLPFSEVELAPDQSTAAN